MRIPFRSAAAFHLLAWLVTSPAGSQPRCTAPVEQSAFSRLTSYDSLQGFLRNIGSQRSIHVERLATTRRGRSVDVVKVSSSPLFGEDTTKLRVLLFAQQHGDEPSGKEALTMLLARLASGEMRNILSTTDLLIVPQMNPDGAELRQRRTADTIDLNRNHLLLTSPETKGLHDLFYKWQPHVTMDIHEYGSFSSEWRDSGFIKTGDVQLGMLTNLNTAQPVRDIQHDKIFSFITERMKREGYSFHEYIVGNPGMYIRHSTTEVNDGRQSLGILGSISFIQEGRKWKSLEDQLRRRTLSQLASAEALLECCSENARAIRSLVNSERRRTMQLAGELIPIRMDHFSSGKAMTIPVQMVNDENDSTWDVRPYRDEVRLLKSVKLPSKYIVPGRDTAIIALLQRHHIHLERAAKEMNLQAEEYTIDSVRQRVLEEESVASVSATLRTVETTIRAGDCFVPTAQIQSRLLAILLEPESQWGLTKYDTFAYLRKEQIYRIKRIP